MALKFITGSAQRGRRLADPTGRLRPDPGLDSGYAADHER